MRTQVVTINSKAITVQEMRICELEELIGKLLPETGGDLSKVKLDDIVGEDLSFDILYDKLPILFQGLKEEDIKNAYMSEIEALVEAFVDVNFFGIKKLIRPLATLIQASSMQK